jgi:hypothetical protein
VTFSAVGANGESITTQVNICPSTGACSLLASTYAASPFSWEWNPTPDPSTYVQAGATDQAGNLGTASGNPADLFDPNPADPGGGAYPVTCGPESCATLAGQDPSDMMDDPPYTGPCGAGGVFSGYADPSMRGDPLVTTANLNGPANPYGTNLYMLYSWPTCNTPDDGAIYLPAVETHLAFSLPPAGVGGPDWDAWCTPFASCSGETPIFPSTPSSVLSPAYAYTSHEVPNFWPYVDQANQTESWYAVHLMYLVSPCPESCTSEIQYGVQHHGCLVISVALGTPGSPATPGDLSWSASSSPSYCLDTAGFPANSAALTYPSLTSMADLTAGTCASWGEPAIMVRSESSGLVGYLAASCFDSNFKSLDYYIFSTTGPSGQDGQSPGTPSTWTWGRYAGPFGYGNLPSNYTLPPGQTQPVNSLSKFDWALRSDGTSLIAIASPESATSAGVLDYQCVAMDFTLAPGPPAQGQPFTSLLATVYDADAPASGPSEIDGPGACTYDPTSNTGIVVVRHLNGGSGYDLYSIINSGVMP